MLQWTGERAEPRVEALHLASEHIRRSVRARSLASGSPVAGLDPREMCVGLRSVETLFATVETCLREPAQALERVCTQGARERAVSGPGREQP